MRTETKEDESKRCAGPDAAIEGKKRGNAADISWTFRRDWGDHLLPAAFLASFAVHVVVVAILVLQPPAPDGLSGNVLDTNNRFVKYMLDVQTRDELVQMELPAFVPRWQKDNPGMAHRACAGKAGSRAAAREIRDARETAREMAMSTGILKYLSNASAPSSPTDSDPENALGALVQAGAGPDLGYGGVGMSGTGRGGGSAGVGTIGSSGERAYDMGNRMNPGSRNAPSTGGLYGVRGLVRHGSEANLDDDPGEDRESEQPYPVVKESSFLDSATHPHSTFSIDVDTAAYSNTRRSLEQYRLPSMGSVRVEEMLNYFSYEYDEPEDGEPFSVNVEVSECPWRESNKLVRIGLRGRETTAEESTSANLVFLIDVSGSMAESNRLPLLKQALIKLVQQLSPQDRVAIVVYADSSGLHLKSTPVSRRDVIIDAIDQLQAGGSTNGGAGIRLAYSQAAANYVEGGVNRVILATDGFFNVGVTRSEELVSRVEREAVAGTFLTILGFGRDTYNDQLLESIADKGNGTLAYIDSMFEARKVLVDQIGGTLVTVAKDVKIQVEFNPEQVSRYRLIGYDNRLLEREDFGDDWKDAGEMGAGHTVTALYEVTLADGTQQRFDSRMEKTDGEIERLTEMASDQLLTLRVRYKEPDAEESLLTSYDVFDEPSDLEEATPDFRFAAAVAGFGMLLKRSLYSGEVNTSEIMALAESGIGDDDTGYREQFIELVERARSLGLDDA